MSRGLLGLKKEGSEHYVLLNEYQHCSSKRGDSVRARAEKGNALNMDNEFIDVVDPSEDEGAVGGPGTS